jgi:protein-S-isoprenylcysteine O-methyltransferase Ste14
MLFGVAAIELVAMWVLWLYPFLRKRFTGPKRPSEVMAHSGDWGLALETAGIFFAWLWLPNTREPVLARIIASMVLAPVAALFGWLSVRHLGKQLRILAGLYADHELIRTGPYAIVRHPVYASLFMMMAGIAAEYRALHRGNRDSDSRRGGTAAGAVWGGV